MVNYQGISKREVIEYLNRYRKQYGIPTPLTVVKVLHDKQGSEVYAIGDATNPASVLLYVNETENCIECKHRIQLLVSRLI